MNQDRILVYLKEEHLIRYADEECYPLFKPNGERTGKIALHKDDPILDEKQRFIHASLVKSGRIKVSPIVPITDLIDDDFDDDSFHSPGLIDFLYAPPLSPISSPL